MTQIPNTKMDKVFSFVRYNKEEKVFVIINFSSEAVSVSFEPPLFEANYTHWSSKESRVFSSDTTRKLSPWQFEVWVS